MPTITSANSVFTLVVPSLFPVPQTLAGFATDDAFANEPVTMAETKMGVDGKMSSGFTPFMTPMTITLQADSASIALFDTWAGAMKVTKEVVTASASIALPGTGRSYTLTNGVLTKYPQLPGVKKLLEPVQYTITWESINPAVL